jgi:hypothetical protein
VRGDGRVVFLDWEGAEEQGMPLWDLLYFLRSYVLLGRVRGLQRRLETFATAFLTDSEQSRWVRQVVDQYCTRVGLHPSLVEPLFYTCWMHRALKEAPRLLPDQLSSGRFSAGRHCTTGESVVLHRFETQPTSVRKDPDDPTAFQRRPAASATPTPATRRR